MDAGATDGVDILKRRPTTLVLRTASKIWGLAAVRFGYGYTSPEIVRPMNSVRLPFNVARPAAVAVLAALDDVDFIERSLENNERGKRYLYGEFARLGLRAYPTAANFIAVEVDVEADAAYQALLERGIIVRSGDGLGNASGTGTQGSAGGGSAANGYGGNPGKGYGYGYGGYGASGYGASGYGAFGGSGWSGGGWGVASGGYPFSWGS